MRYTFETALAHLKQGRKIRRAKWDEGFLKIHQGKPRLFWKGEPWDARDIEIDPAEESLSLDDIMAEDWEVVE